MEGEGEGDDGRRKPARENLFKTRRNHPGRARRADVARRGRGRATRVSRTHQLGLHGSRCHLSPFARPRASRGSRTPLSPVRGRSRRCSLRPRTEPALAGSPLAGFGARPRGRRGKSTLASARSNSGASRDQGASRGRVCLLVSGTAADVPITVRPGVMRWDFFSQIFSVPHALPVQEWDDSQSHTFPRRTIPVASLPARFLIPGPQSWSANGGYLAAAPRCIGA